jgi:hypothetical protein
MVPDDFAVNSRLIYVGLLIEALRVTNSEKCVPGVGWLGGMHWLFSNECLLGKGLGACFW